MNENPKQMSQKDLIKIELKERSSHFAFLYGNGVNKYINKDFPDWKTLLNNLYKEIIGSKVNCKFKGISYTELYEILKLKLRENGDANSEVTILNKVIEMIDTTNKADYQNPFNIAMYYDVPVLTTNFDRNLDSEMKKSILKVKNEHQFSNYYPWNVYYAPKNAGSKKNVYGYGVWHINGSVDYKRSVKLGVKAYMNMVSKAKNYLHDCGKNSLFCKQEGDDSDGQIHPWKGANTWLELFFNCSLCIIGLSLDENETFLRWLLIQRASFNMDRRDNRRKGWYLCRQKDIDKYDGKRLFLETVGIQIIEFNEYSEIYDFVKSLN